ncbi:FecR family protein [Terrimonas rubra]|uniref:FecR family protein n=1 Tax=Terrimonas rubra TaxID=1035890 RepID=A0ABW6A7X8_9BACT
MRKNRYTYLLQGWLNQQLSPAEVDEFLLALQDQEFQNLIGDDMLHSLQSGQFEHFETKEEKAKALALLMSGIHQSQASSPAKVMKLVWLKRLTAAAVLTGLCITGYFIFTKPEKNIPVIVQEKIEYPVTNQAVITLPDGTQLRIDTISTLVTLAQYGIQIERAPGGELLYKSITGNEAVSALPIKIDNPRGSTPLHVQLTDGSHVWLNAQSTITYPVIFAAGKREVNVSGEAYFEVTRDPAKKFIVKTAALTTEVLGTHFDVKAYEDEPTSKVTLLEGSVKVSAAQPAGENIMRPGQQAVVNGQDIAIIPADLQEAMAWKNDLLSFNGAGIRTIMLEISRWYDVDVVYTGNTPDKKFSGYISRQTSLDDLLKIIKQSGFNLRTEGRTIYVLPN